MKAEHVHEPVRQSVIFIAYYAVLIAFLVASFFPQYRLWGVNWWAYFPGYVPFVLFAIGAVAPIVMQLVLRRGESDVGNDRSSANGGGKYFIIVCCLTVLYALAFYLLRARTHFLGDGYQILSKIASDNVFIKPTEQGEILVHVWVKSFIGGVAETSALLSYQIVSISAGVLFLVTVAWVSKRLFERNIDRILFWLGLTSSGYMLLFFGYVENYSLFVLSVATYSLMGLLVIKGKINRWLVLPFVALPIFFHILGVTLIPSAIYLLVANSKLGNVVAGLNKKTKLLMGVITVVIFLSLFYYFYSTSYFFRFAFVPLFDNRFTVEEYTLFYGKHLLDYLNLLLILLPGLLLVVVTLLFSPVREVFQQREYRYLMILVFSTLGAVFILDPKLGMPRDWDLFSFSGVPLAILSYYLLLNIRSKYRLGSQIVFLAVLLGLLSLFPRVGSQAVENISVTHLMNYIDLDKARSLPVRAVLIGYYRKLGKQDTANQLTQRWSDELIENNMLLKSLDLLKQNQVKPAISQLEQLLKRNPGMATAWARLGEGYLLLGENDSALKFLSFAEGMNPYNPAALFNMGFAYYAKKEYEKAERYFLRASEIDGHLLEPLLGLAYVYDAQLGQQDKYIDILLRAGSRDDAPVQFIQKLGNYYLQGGQYQLAAETYERALRKGMDSSYFEMLIEEYPQLRQ
jgi:tetratricopeptide (TPR) repeat protein